jgi:hypothetical protein
MEGKKKRTVVHLNALRPLKLHRRGVGYHQNLKRSTMQEMLSLLPRP